MSNVFTRFVSVVSCWDELLLTVLNARRTITVRIRLLSFSGTDLIPVMLTFTALVFILVHCGSSLSIITGLIVA